MGSFGLCGNGTNVVTVQDRTPLGIELCDTKEPRMLEQGWKDQVSTKRNQVCTPHTCSSFAFPWWFSGTRVLTLVSHYMSLHVIARSILCNPSLCHCKPFAATIQRGDSRIQW